MSDMFQRKIVSEQVYHLENKKENELDHIIIGHDGNFVSLMRHELVHFSQRGASTMHTYEEKSPEE